MRRGLRYSPVPPRGNRRIGLLGLGLLAALSLVWQQQATLASYTDAEFAGGTFTAATLEPISPTFTTTAATATATWDAPARYWAPPAYVLTGATSALGANATQVYAGPATTATRTVGGTSTTESLSLTGISAGGTHACGIARGQLYCWGTSTTGALGLGSTTSTSTPTRVGGALSSRIVTDVSAGASHTCAVADGAAYCWGSGANGRTGLGGTANTTTPGAVSGIPSGRTVTSVSAGGSHGCAVADGAAYCWGNNGNGQLGRGSTTSGSTAAAVTTVGVLAGRTVTAISAGTSHSCAVADGLAFCWGLNTSSRLGDGTTTQRTSPVAVTAATGVLLGRTVTAISAGGSHTCAVADGRAFCWGLNTNGRLGDGTTTTRTTPVAVVGTVGSATEVTAISAGNSHSCAIADDRAHCWGAGASGQIGNGSTGTSVVTPVAVTATGVLSGRNLAVINAGTNFTCANGATPGSCWGLGTSGQLGNRASASSTTAVDVAITGPVCANGSVRIGSTDCSLVQDTSYWGRIGYTIGTWVAPDSGWVRATTRTRDAVSPSASARTSTTLTLGWDQVSELEDSYAEYTLQRSTSSSGSSPVTIYKGGLRAALDRGGIARQTASLEVDHIASGTDHTCAVLEGAAYCWGDNANGELGIGSTADATSPTAVVTTGALAGKTVSAISAAMDDGNGNGGQHTCAVADGGVYCWGLNANGELGNGSTTQSTTAVQAGTLAGATAVTTGYMHSCALTGGEVYCWGDNSRGQLGDGTTTQRTAPVRVQGLLAGRTVTAIAAGAAHSCAVADGAAYCWGSNVSGQLGINTSGSASNSPTPVAVLATGALNGLTVTQVTAGEAHNCVVAGGNAYCWGYNASGQVGNGSTGTALAAVAVTPGWANGATLTGLAAGQYGTCVLAGGKAYCWGENGNSQLGNNSTTDATTPVAVTTSLMSGTVAEVAPGGAHTCALSGTTAYCWGLNSEGRLGTGNTTAAAVPVAVQAVAGAPCATGASLITPTTCSLTPGRTYYYRVKFTVDGAIPTTSDWVGIKTTS